MPKLAFSPAALKDIREIGDYIDQDNRTNAQRFVARIKTQCVKVASNPLSYPAREDLIAGVRMATLDKYLIFYTVTEHEVRIQRVLHSARSLLDILAKKPHP